MNPVQITSATGVEDNPAWAREGRTLAYTSTPGRESRRDDVWVAQLERTQPVSRTKVYEGFDCCPSWSPDGAEIAFWSDREGGGYFVMSALGGPARKLIAAPPDLSQFNARNGPPMEGPRRSRSNLERHPPQDLLDGLPNDSRNSPPGLGRRTKP